VFFFVIRDVLLLIVMFYVLFMCKCVLPPGVNPIAVDKYINININVFCDVQSIYVSEESTASIFRVSYIHKMGKVGLFIILADS
jgi:hypothetical protein